MLSDEFRRRIEANGGYVNCHGHFDRAFTLTQEDFFLDTVHVPLAEKWHLVDRLKRESTIDDYKHRISLATLHMRNQGVKLCATFIDVDSVVQLKALEAAVAVKDAFAGLIKLQLACQTLKGVIDRNERRWIEKALPFLDIVGGLPSKDAPNQSKHIDILCQFAKETGKPLHVHVDQGNMPNENETEILAEAAIRYGLEGRVTAVHSISLAAQPERSMKRMMALMKDAGMSLICCPSAAISMMQPKKMSITHNSIAPILALLDAGIVVGLGVDNINDIYMPFVDGDLWFEIRVLMESCRFYDIDELVAIATANGRSILSQC